MNNIQVSHAKNKQIISRIIASLLAIVIIFSLLQFQTKAENDPVYRFGTAETVSSYTTGKKLIDSYYYSDSWFLKNPEERNDELALLSMQISSCSHYSKKKTMGTDYLKDMGFDSRLVRANPADSNIPEYVLGTKTIGTGADSFTLAAITINDYGNDNESWKNGWIDNFVVNGEEKEEWTGEHYSFAKTADALIDSIASLESSRPIKFWIFGHSRGAAIANILAVRLKERLQSPESEIFAYTFESPATIDASLAAKNEGKYPFIHNYIFTDDLVAKAPFWGMTRYGVTYQLTDVGPEERIQEELVKLGSDAVGVTITDNDLVVEERVVNAIVNRIPTREAYSSLHTDAFTDLNGNDTEVQYVYQKSICNLIDVVLSNSSAGTFDGITGRLNEVLERKNEYIRSLLYFYFAVQSEYQGLDASKYYWAAANDISEFLNTFSKEPILAAEDIYVYLRIAGPLLIDPSADLTANISTAMSDDNMAAAILPAVTPAMELFDSATKIVLSHHVDLGIARMKMLAPQPALDPIAVTIQAPKAGDQTGKAGSEIASAIVRSDAYGRSYLSAEASWNEETSALSDNAEHLLDVKIRSVGHTVTSNLPVSINGMEPEGALTVTHENGADIISGTWRFTIGNPPKVTVNFDTNGYGNTPDALTLVKGRPLQNVTAPAMPQTISNSDGTWKFCGWFDKDGTPWSELVANQDLTVYAKWMYEIDNIQLSLSTYPKVGDTGANIMIPEGAKYKITNLFFTDKSYDEVSTIEQEGEIYRINLTIEPVDRAVSEIACVIDEYESHSFTGKIFMNGKELIFDYSDLAPSQYFSGEDLALEIPFKAEKESVPVPVRETVTPSVTLSNSAFTYNGMVQKPAVTSVKVGTETLTYADYEIVNWSSGCKNVGTYNLTVKLKESCKYQGSNTVSFKIKKAAQPIIVKQTASKLTLKNGPLKKAQTIKLSKYAKVSKNQGALSFKKTGGSKQITVDKKTGKLTVAKGTKKGTYKVSIRISAAGNSNYKSGYKTVKQTIIVK